MHVTEFCHSFASCRLGGVVGLTICLSALCADGSVDSRSRIGVIHGRLSMMVEQFDASSPDDEVAFPFERWLLWPAIVFGRRHFLKPSSMFQALCFCIASVTGAAYVANAIAIDAADVVCANLLEIHLAHPEASFPAEIGRFDGDWTIPDSNSCG